MGEISSATTTNRQLIEAQQATLDTLVTQNTELELLLRELIEAIKEITNR